MLLLLLACKPPVEPSAAVDPPDPSLLLVRFTEARGGDKLVSRKSVRIEGVVTGPDSEALFTEVGTSGGHYRMDTQVRGKPFVVACDGDTGWTWQGISPVLMDPIEQRAACSSVDLWAPIEGELRSMGAERVAGHDAWRVDVEEMGQPARSFWFDQDSYLMVARAWRVGGVQVREDLLDWQDQEGILMPSTVVSAQSGLSFEKRSVTWDVEDLPEFSMPDAW